MKVIGVVALAFVVSFLAPSSPSVDVHLHDTYYVVPSMRGYIAFVVTMLIGVPVVAARRRNRWLTAAWSLGVLHLITIGSFWFLLTQWPLTPYYRPYSSRSSWASSITDLPSLLYGLVLSGSFWVAVVCLAVGVWRAQQKASVQAGAA